MINLQHINETDVIKKINLHLNESKYGSQEWRILASALKISERYSFTENRTYPRPDHPDEKKRKPLIYMLVAIIVSLRTTLENEQKAVLNLIDRFPTENLLFNATPEEIESCIIPAGMAKTKSVRIRKALDHIIDNYNGRIELLSNYDKNNAREHILKIPGIGPKAADCLLSIGLGIPSIAVDINVFRVASWLFDLPWSLNPNYNDKNQVYKVKQLLDNAVGHDAFLCQIIHTYFLLLGKDMKSKHPVNKPCYIGEYCLTCKNNSLNHSNRCTI
jgi:endonuclease III